MARRKAISSRRRRPQGMLGLSPTLGKLQFGIMHSVTPSHSHNLHCVDYPLCFGSLSAILWYTDSSGLVTPVKQFRPYCSRITAKIIAYQYFGYIHVTKFSSGFFLFKFHIKPPRLLYYKVINKKWL